MSGQGDAEETALLVAVNHVVPVSGQHPERLDAYQKVQKELPDGGTDRDLPNEGNPPNARNDDVWFVDRLSEVIGQQVHLVPQCGERREAPQNT